jgi:hypothetical protein
MAGMDHSAMPGMQHGARALPPQPPPPVTNAAIARTQPAATLRADEFDAPAPVSVDESVKAGAGMSHAIEPRPPSGHQHQHGGSAS